MKKSCLIFLAAVLSCMGGIIHAQDQTALGEELLNYTELKNEYRFEEALVSLNKVDSLCRLVQNPFYFKILYNEYARLKEDLGDYGSAKKHYLTAMGYCSDDIQSKAIILQNLASLSLQAGAFHDAKNYAEEALEISPQALDSLYSLRWSALASAYMGNRKTALKRIQEADEICRQSLPEDLYESILQVLKKAEVKEVVGDCADAAVDYESALSNLTEYFGANHQLTISALCGKAKTSLLAGETATALKNYEDYYLRKMGFLEKEILGLNSHALNKFIISKNEGMYDAPLFCELSDGTYGRIREIALNISLLCKTVFIKERKGEYTIPDWKKTAGLMDEKSVAVDFVKYRDGRNMGIYGAFIYSAGHEYPEFMRLCSEKEILSIIGDAFLMNGSEARTAFSNENMTALHKLLWNPLAGRLASYEKLYFSPAGILNNIPLEYLPDEDSCKVCDSFKEVHRLIIPTEVKAPSATEGYNKAFVFGQINYFETEEVRATSNYFAPLKYAVKDMSNIRSILNPRLSTKMFSGKSASEENFRNISFVPDDKAIIHFSTHGFYLPDSLSNFSSYYKNFKPEDIRSFPMLRCGLALAGANKVWSGSVKASDTANDGILTAQEISMMDLSKAELVVLAACQTGLGDINKDGSWGLPRAFKTAGAGKLLVSLWPTNDKSATELIRLFYNELMEGRKPNEALKSASGKLAQIPEYAAPYHWAAFVIID